MNLLSIISGAPESELITGYLLAVVVLFVSMFVIVSVVLLHQARGIFGLADERAGALSRQRFFGLMRCILRGRDVHRGTMLLLSLLIVGVLVIFVLASALSCMCLSTARNVDFSLIAVFVLIVLAVGLIRR